MSEFFFVRYWSGRGNLWRVFWICGVLLSSLAIGLITWAYSAGWFSHLQLKMAVLVLFAYTIWILVSVWRCAARRGDDYYAILARWLTVAWALNAIFVGGFVLLDL